MGQRVKNCPSCDSPLGNFRFSFSPRVVHVYGFCLSESCPHHKRQRWAGYHHGNDSTPYSAENQPPFKHCVNGSECVCEIGSWQPVTNHFFRASRLSKSGFMDVCKACLSEKRYEKPLQPYWQRALEYWDHSCAVCGLRHERKPDDDRRLIHEDHWFIPKLKGGKLGVTNSLPLCAKCNVSKSDRNSVEWIMEKLGEKAARERLVKIEAYFNWAAEQ